MPFLLLLKKRQNVCRLLQIIGGPLRVNSFPASGHLSFAKNRTQSTESRPMKMLGLDLDPNCVTLWWLHSDFFLKDDKRQ